MINAVKTVFAVEKTVPATITYPINDGDVLVYDANSGTFINQPPTSNPPEIIPANTILSNITVGSSVPEPNSLSAILDKTFSNQQGNIIYRNESEWTYLTPGTLGQVLSSNGISTDPSWIVTVSNVSTDSTLIGGPITTEGTLGINLAHSNIWTAQQNFNGNLSLGSTKYALFNGTSDTNWRMGLGITAFSTQLVGLSTSIQLVLGTNSSGPDGFAIGQTNGQSIFELRGSDGSALFTGNVSILGSLTQAGNPVSFDNITTVTENTIIDGTYRTVLVDASSGPITITVQAISVNVIKRLHNIKKIDSSNNVVNIVVSDGSTIDDQTTVVLDTQYQSRTVQASNIQWWII